MTELLGRFDASMPSMPVAQPTTQEPHEVHFTYTAPDAVTFDWRGDGTTMRYWAKDLPPRTVNAHLATPTPTSMSGPFQEAVVDQLVPGLEYEFEVGQPMKPQGHAFHAPPAPGASGFSFVAVGDIGDTGGQPLAAGVHRNISLAEPWFVLALGDLSYADLKNQTAVDRHFDDVMVWSQRAAYMPAWGNHEWSDPQRDDLRNYKGRFALPNAAASPGAPAIGCCGEDWYWFDFGSIRFIIYPEPYTHDTWVDWAKRAEPLFVEAEANPLIKFVITAGTGGGALEHAASPCLWDICKPPSFTAFRAIHHGFVKISVRPKELQVEAICGPSSTGNQDISCAAGEIFDGIVTPAGGTVEPRPPRHQADQLVH